MSDQAIVIFVCVCIASVMIGAIGVCLAYTSEKKANAWKDYAIQQDERFENLMKWLARQCKEDGEFHRDGNVVEFKRK